MEFKIGAEVFASYINIVSKIVSSKANMPILNNILLDVTQEGLTLTGTDLEVQISAKTTLKPQKTGRTSVNAKLFSQYISTIPKKETVTVKLNKGMLLVESTVGSAEFSTRDVDEFPLFEEEAMEEVFGLPSETYHSMISNTIFACAKDDIRPILSGVNIEIEDSDIVMVALDTFRLSKMSGKSSVKFVGKKQFVVPSNALENVVKVVNDSFISSITDRPEVTCSVAKNANFVLLKYGDIKVFARLIEGEYPPYKTIIPVAHQTEATVSRVAWLDSLKRVGIFAQSAISQKVVLTFANGKLTMEAQVPEVGNVKEEFEITQEGDPIKLAFQSKFLMDILTLSSDDVLVFRATSKTAAGVFIQPTIESFLHILMPLKLDD